MFRALYENFQNEAINELNQNIVRYQSVEPNLTIMNNSNNYPFPNGGTAATTQFNQAINNLANVTNPIFETTTTSQPNLGTVFTGIPDTMGQRMSDCRKFTGLVGLSNLMGQTNLSAEQRCGWRYKPGQGVVAEVAQGAFGTRSGPLDPARPPTDAINNGIQYYWNLQDAEKKMVADICKAATNCQDMGTVPVSAVGDFSNVCGYCKTSKKIIPIRRDGNSVRPRYNSVDIQCAPSEIVTVNEAATKCPPPDPAQQETVYWKCLKQGNLERDCVTLSALFAGCNPNGTLVSALTQGTNPQDYADKLRQKKSFQVYQSLANPVLSEDVIKNGNATIFASFMNIYNLNQNQYRTDNAKTMDQNKRIQVAAQDLCRQSGLYETYNFCTDLTDQSRDFEVGCMQQEFLRQGGTVEGTAYPKVKGSDITTWGNYKRSVADLVLTTNSANINDQRFALNQLKGLGLQTIPTTLPRGEQSQGVETFWFWRREGPFLGRRAVLSATGSNLPNFNVGGGVVEDIGLTDNVECISLFELRPQSFTRLRFGVVTDDGFSVALNQDPLRPVDQTRVFSRMYDQGPTWHQSQCFNIQAESANAPNIVSWYWYENGGGAVFHPFYGDCTRNTWTEIAQKGRPLDPNWVNMCYFTQEVEAPMLTFGAYQRGGGSLAFQEKRMTTLFPVSNTSTTYGKVNDPSMPNNLTITKLDSRVLRINRFIAYSAVRTVVFCFLIEDIDRPRVIFNWNQFQEKGFVQLQATKLSSGDFSIHLDVKGANPSQVQRRGPFTVAKNTWNIAAITLTTASKFTKKISGAKFFVQSVQKLRDGTLPAESAIQPSGLLFEEAKINPYVVGIVLIGDTGVKMQVGWLDFYDNTIETSDVRLWKKVAQRDWLGRWYE